MSVSIFERTQIENKKAFIVGTQLNSISGTSQHPYLYLKNPTDSGVRAFISHISFGLDHTSSRSRVAIWTNPTVTGDGTSLTIKNTSISASPPVTALLAFKDPTVTDNGEFLDCFLQPANTPSRGATRFYILEESNSVLFTMKNSVANAESMISCFWLEL